MSNEKKIKVVSGSGKNINISDVKEHLNIEKPREDDSTPKSKILIPKKKKK